jgi:hypothetical protein
MVLLKVTATIKTGSENTVVINPDVEEFKDVS